jgi:hypothetical protein
MTAGMGPVSPAEMPTDQPVLKPGQHPKVALHKRMALKKAVATFAQPREFSTPCRGVMRVLGGGCDSDLPCVETVTKPLLNSGSGLWAAVHPIHLSGLPPSRI